jgi:catechol 2,3-dioxygenase-like lactoylglutathione lyase family enzyme
VSIQGFDHVAIPIANIAAMRAFYRQLGFTVEEHDLDGLPFDAVHFGQHRFNFHHPPMWKSDQFDLRAPNSVPGCGDFCFVWSDSVDALQRLLDSLQIPVELGPVARRGGRAGGSATGQSVYIRDPDRNLLEFIVYPEA